MILKLKHVFMFWLLKGLRLGDFIASGSGVEPSLGNSLPLSAIPLGTQVSSVQISKTTNFATSAVLLLEFCKKVLSLWFFSYHQGNNEKFLRKEAP